MIDLEQKRSRMDVEMKKATVFSKFLLYYDKFKLGFAFGSHIPMFTLFVSCEGHLDTKS